MAAPVRVAPAPQRADDPEANTETDAGAEDEPGIDEFWWRRNVDRGIILIGPRAVDFGWVVDGYIQHRWLRWLDDHLGTFAHDRDLRGRAETTSCEGAVAEKLNLRHRLHLLVGKGNAERLSSVKMLVHHRDDLREGNQRFDARVP